MKLKSTMAIFSEQAENIRLLMLLARQEPERFGLTVCGVCHTPIEKLQGVGLFLPNDEVANRISPAGKYRIVMFTLCPDCAANGGEGIDEEIIKVLQAH